MFSVTFMNETRFTPFIMALIWRMIETMFVSMTTTTIFKIVILVPCLLKLHNGMSKKVLTLPPDYRTGTLISIYVQHLLNDRKKCLASQSLRIFLKL